MVTCKCCHVVATCHRFSTDPMLPLGLHNADLLGNNHPRIYDSSGRPIDEDTESPRGARDAGPPGGWVDDLNMPLQQWDTGVLQSPQDANPLGSRPPWIDEPPGLQHSWDTVQLQGSQDASPLSLQHSGVDEMPQPLTLESSTLSKMPQHHSEIRFKALLLDSKSNYEQKYGKQLDFLVCPKKLGCHYAYSVICPFNSIR